MTEILIYSGIAVAVLLAIAAILMPIWVYIIAERVWRIERLLESMEDMMRNGR